MTAILDGYQHVADFLSDQSSTELTAWSEYLRMEDERFVNLVAYAIVKAFGGDKKQQAVNKQQVQDDEEDEPVIDTTDPKFLEEFRGFSYGNQAPTVPPARIPTSTEILFG